MAHVSTPLARARAAILGALLVLAAAAWAVLVWQSSMTDTDDMENMLTMDMGVPLFLAIWVAMMVAMMFPTAAPMILTFAKIQQGKRQGGKPYVPGCSLAPTWPSGRRSARSPMPPCWEPQNWPATRCGSWTTPPASAAES